MTEPAAQSPIQRCRDCGAWLEARREQCPLCGIAWPTSQWLALRQQSGLAWRDLGATLGAVGGMIAGLVTWLFWQHAVRAGLPGPLRFGFVLLCAATAYALGRALLAAQLAFALAAVALAAGTALALRAEWLFAFPDGAVGTALVALLGATGWLLGATVLPRAAAANWDRRQPRNVREIQRLLADRLATLPQTLEKMRMLGLRLKQSLPAGAENPAIATLREAYAATERQYHRHLVDLWRVETAIWQNRVQPILATWRHLDQGGCEAAVATLDAVSRDGERLAAEWQAQQRAVDPRAERTLAQLQRLLAAVAHLREAVLVRQAAVLAEATPGIHEAFAVAELPGEAQLQIDQLHQSKAVVDWSVAAPDFAAERERLQAEQAAIREVERLIAD